MEVVIVLGILVVAALIMIGISYGNLFACVFLSLPVGLVALICAAQAKQDMWGGFLLCLAMLGAIWAPRVYRNSR